MELRSFAYSELEVLWIAGPKLQPLGSPKLDPAVWLNFAKEGGLTDGKIACRTHRLLTIACLKMTMMTRSPVLNFRARTALRFFFFHERGVHPSL